MRQTRCRRAVLAGGMVMGLLFGGCGRADRPGQRTTKPSAGQADAREAKWLAAWARGEKGKQPAWAGGTEVLIWPDDVPDDVMKSWAKEKGLAGLSEEEIRRRLGRPVKVLTNESVGCRLLLYADGCVEIVSGRCGGWAPRSATFEKYFLQPDL